MRSLQGGQSLEHRVLHLPAGCVSLLQPHSPAVSQDAEVSNNAQYPAGPKHTWEGVKAISPSCSRLLMGAQPPLVSAVHLSSCLVLDTGRPSGSCYLEAPQRRESTHLAFNHWLHSLGATDLEKLVPTACVSRKESSHQQPSMGTQCAALWPWSHVTSVGLVGSAGC